MVVGLAGRIYGGFDEHGLCIPRISEYSTYIYINRLFCSLHFRKLTDTFIDIIDVFLRKTAFAVKVGNYWNEFIMDAYVNHQSDMIYLAGYHDIPLSKPHSRESQKKMGY
jgi:hypothetical protein